jgi:hypothetical protein
LQAAVCVASQSQESGIGTQRIKHGINARFHHFLLAHRLVALVLIEVAFEKAADSLTSWQRLSPAPRADIIF